MNNKEKYIEVNKKSQLASFLLTFLFGPLGLLYSNWKAAIFMMVATGLSAMVGAWPLMWLICIVVGSSMVGGFNEKLEAKANLTL